MIAPQPDQTVVVKPGKPGKKPPGRYRAVTALGVLSLAFGVLSALAVVEWVWGVLPAAGIVLGWIALRRIYRTPEEITGAGFAKAGVIFSAVFWAVGVSYLTYVYFTQAPAGYKPVSYAMLQLPPDAPPGQLVPPAAEELDGERVYIRGYMVPGRQQSGIKRFFLSDDPGVCSFCVPKPKVTQLIEVKLTNDMEAEYTTHLIGLGGKFRVDTGRPKKKTEEKPEEAARLKPGEVPPERPGGGVVYQLEADYLR
jgi:hypothetical protein